MTFIKGRAEAKIDRRILILDGEGKGNRGTARVSDLRGHPFVVLLGEPGIGKSTVLTAEAEREILPVWTVRELMTATTVPSGTTLYLDALDEYRSDGGADDKAHTLANVIMKSASPRWRLSCRSEDWRKSADITPISRTTSGNTITVVQLLPLEPDEAVLILRALGEAAPEEFVRTAHSFGASAFLENPLGVRLLHSAVADGAAWPDNRFGLFSAAVRKLAFEHSDVRIVAERHGPDAILDAAAETCLVMLASGARAVWRSNREPPSVGDNRAFVTWHELQIGRDLFNDMIDTPLFRGEGEAFEPMHRTVAEFLAGRALSAAVCGTRKRAALPLSRALAFVTSPDGAPPTELRGLFAWFAAHLARTGQSTAAIRLIEQDAVSVLSYGDSAIFDYGGRRAILENLGRSDPYFRASEVGVTAVGGLAGEDLAADFAAVLRDTSDITHRRYTVFEALTVGRPVLSLRPLLQSIVLDRESPEWHRLRALEALLNGHEDPAGLCRSLFDALAAEAPLSAREAVRSQLASHIAKGQLTVRDVRSVLVDYCGCRPDNMLGRLRALQGRIENDPVPELFDDPLASWLPARPGNDSQRDHRTEVGHTLDFALAAAMLANPAPSPSRLWRWIANTRRGGLSPLKNRAKMALISWLEEGLDREVALFEAILAAGQESDGPWLASNKFQTAVGRRPSTTVVESLLRQAAEAETPTMRDRLLAVVVEIVGYGSDEPTYWSTFDQVTLTGSSLLLANLTVRDIEPWHSEQALRNASAKDEEQIQRLQDISDLTPLTNELRSGGHANGLRWAACIYFERDGEPNIQRVIDRTNDAIAKAIAEGWEAVVINGLGAVDTALLGVSEAEQRCYCVEEAAVAGVYRRLVDDEESALHRSSIESAIAVLKSSWISNENARIDKLDRWAVKRLDVDPEAGAAQLLIYWKAALGVGSIELPGLSKFNVENVSPALDLALRSILKSHPAMKEAGLRSALRLASKIFDKDELLSLANAALDNLTLEEPCRELWVLVVSVLDPLRSSMMPPDPSVDRASLLFDGANGELARSLAAMEGVDSLPMRVSMVRSFGPKVAPEDERSLTGGVTDTHRRSQTVRSCIDLIAGDPRLEAATALSILSTDPPLVRWSANIRHARAQQLRVMRDQSFRHPSALAVRDALEGGQPVNAIDLRAIIVSELLQLRTELRSTDSTPWKHYWNNQNGRPTTPLIENECRDRLLERLRDKLPRYRIAAVIPEARRGNETRVDMLVLTGAGRNLPIEIKRHFHPDLWTAAATQLQGYASDPGADGAGIYLVLWFGNDVASTPARSDGRDRPSSALDLEVMLVEDLDGVMASRTDVVVFDVSDPTAAPRKMRRSRKLKTVTNVQ